MVTSQDFIHRLKSQNYMLNKQYHVKVMAKRFHLNGHIIGFHPQTQKLESPYKTPPSTLAVKGFKNRIHQPDCKIHQPWAIRHDFLCMLQRIMGLLLGTGKKKTGQQLTGTSPVMIPETTAGHISAPVLFLFSKR